MGRTYPIARIRAGHDHHVRFLIACRKRLHRAQDRCVTWQTPRQLATPAWKSSASCARYFRDFDRLVRLSTRVRPVSGQPAQVSTEFQSRLAELTWEQTKIAVELSCRGVRTRRGLCQRALPRGGQGCLKANRVRTARTSQPIPRNSVSTYCTCIRRSSQSRTGGIATPYPRRRCFYDQRLTTSSCRHWLLHSG